MRSDVRQEGTQEQAEKVACAVIRGSASSLEPAKGEGGAEQEAAVEEGLVTARDSTAKDPG
jgi:hypothetical protein